VTSRTLSRQPGRRFYEIANPARWTRPQPGRRRTRSEHGTTVMTTTANEMVIGVIGFAPNSRLSRAHRGFTNDPLLLTA